MPFAPNATATHALLSHALVATVVAVAGLLIPVSFAEAQPPERRPLLRSNAVVCPMSERLLSITLIDSLSGEPIDRARVSFKHTPDAVWVHEGSRITPAPGSWVFMDAGGIDREAAREGVVGELLVERDGRAPVRRAITVGLDSTGCHLVFRGPAEIRL